MIIGVVPIGGKGTRLSLPYSKEMIPQKNFNFFNPIVNHLVEKMELAGAKKIVFVHGSDYKDDICKFFNDTKYLHILQERLGFANVIYDFYNQVPMNKGDVVLVGLPDSVFDENPFVEMINKSGSVCGLFVTNDRSKVDRLDSTNKEFQIKTEKTKNNQELFWGVLKFDSENISQMVEDKVFDQYSEIGAILNKYTKSFVQGKSYLDLGTWENYNRYLSNTTSFTNVEIEKKYDASLVDLCDFIEYFSFKPDSINEIITSTDFYYTTNDTNIEFVRYREKSNDPGSVGDLTVKNFNKSQLNRFELTVPLAESVKTHNVLHLLTLLGSKYQFEVTKRCNIYKFHNYTVVFYSFLVNEKEFKIIEIELHTIDFNLLVELENSMSVIKGFNPSNIINKSKFQIIREQLNDPAYPSTTR